ncbi:MAG TPA: adenylate/guanylate cyclase domain-containing protein [Gaiellaceae bacterium]|nr:adenylate/guanylate cyclase domain-containing protein [Gaiellaceae bacterium]
MAICSNCAAQNRDEAKFCGECGAALGSTCPSCGAANEPGRKFCDQCGTLLAAAASSAPGLPAASAPAEAPAAERRLVSVLFADLVGFTTLSESRDAEEVRELLSRYFDTCRRLVELYGGTVEKFIGDAVMAVWGTPVATEDDVERAVRAALDLVAAVSALGQELGAENLRARAGVLTGEAAVNPAAVGQGMVAGDLVNTASRVQSVADPGSVFVGDATRRASQQAIVYEPAGAFQLKGKEGETELWRAVRVVSGRGGELRSHGLEAPFVGRERELRQIKELFHICADEKRAQLVSVTGIAGIGKSRLSWEFYKYFDGIVDTVYWHRGRCLAYGEGVTYWALADMVRMRCRIAEDEEHEAALGKLRATLEEHILDAGERSFVEPRLAQLLGLGGAERSEREDLFAAWRLFFERLAETYATVLAFEDMQWADASLLDFVEYLLEWSRNHPLFVITLARLELQERRPNWGAGHRNFTSLYLEPLSESAMVELLQGLVPGLPAQLQVQVLARAEGVPLYAVETVRMLLDRGLLVEEGAAYRVVGEVESLEVPETLHALVAARLDGLSAEERRLLQDAAVVGKTFTPRALEALTGIGRSELDPLLASLVRKELLGLQADPRSPEHGQYGFLQDIVRHVAYETLSRKERRAKHLAAAEHLSGALAEEEVVEVVASHLLDAYRLDPDAPDARELRMRAHAALLRAGERAAALGAAAEAQRYLEQSAELADDPGEQAASLIRAGEMAARVGEHDRAGALFERALKLYEQIGDTHGAARASSWCALVDQIQGRASQAIERMERAYEAIADDEPDEDLALLLVRLGGVQSMSGKPDLAAERIERALDIAEALRLTDTLCRGWNAKAIILSRQRPEEARGIFRMILDTALANELYTYAGVANVNLSDHALRRDRYEESLGHLEQALEHVRRIGDRSGEWFTLGEMSFALTMLGRWDEALARHGEIPDEYLGTDVSMVSTLSGPLELHLHRGVLADARALIARFDMSLNSGDVQAEGCHHAATAAICLAEGNPRGALAAAERAMENLDNLGIGSQDVKLGFVHALEAALALDERARAAELLKTIDKEPVGLRPPLLAAMAHRFRARLAGDDPGVDREFTAAASGLRELGLPFHLAGVQLEHGEWLLAQGRPGDADALFDQAQETFERLEARPWLERLARARAESSAAEVPA